METIAPEMLALVQKELGAYSAKQIKQVLSLLGEGNTVPFIARYRKELTGNLDEVQIREIDERYQYTLQLEKRKADVIKAITEQEKLTPVLQKAIMQAEKMQVVEDLYRPFKQKRRTKATIAKEQGLQPFAEWLQRLPETGDIEKEAAKYITEEVVDTAAVLAGAHEILAEQIGEHAKYRKWVRQFTANNGSYVSQVKDKAKDENGVYEMYYDFTSSLKQMVSYRTLATNRGEKEGVLKVKIVVDESRIFDYFKKQLLTQLSPATALIEKAYEDAYKRFIAPAIERELRNELTEQADEKAIQVFGVNLRQLLLQPPLKGKIVLGFDPAYRTGCKLAIVDATGKVLAIDVIYPHPPAAAAKRAAAGPQFLALVEKYAVDIVAIGNGTASRESEAFVAEQLKQSKRDVQYIIISEAGASVYSASAVARQEFPDLQVEERSAISISRRLQDPLAELVKIDPQAVGVGQYQHDVAQKRLGEQLDFVVETVVNQVGVDVNTASPQLLQHVAGLNKTTAQNIVTYREENGAFAQRSALKKVPRLGPKAYEQAIGFLRIPEGKNILDNTEIHPESYPVAKAVLAEAKLSLAQVGSEQAQATLANVDHAALANQLSVGEMTLTDIVNGLLKPGRDMRDQMPKPLLRTDVLTMEDLRVGMELKGTVRNVIDFGAFVDIGVKADGLVHISKLSRQFVKDPNAVVAVGDIVTVWIEAVDVAKKRISLTMLAPE